MRLDRLHSPHTDPGRHAKGRVILRVDDGDDPWRCELPESGRETCFRRLDGVTVAPAVAGERVAELDLARRFEDSEARVPNHASRLLLNDGPGAEAQPLLRVRVALQQRSDGRLVGKGTAGDEAHHLRVT